LRHQPQGFYFAPGCEKQLGFERSLTEPTNHGGMRLD
jgi:hypothetical protein